MMIMAIRNENVERDRITKHKDKWLYKHAKKWPKKNVLVLSFYFMYQSIVYLSVEYNYKIILGENTTKSPQKNVEQVLLKLKVVVHLD